MKNHTLGKLFAVALTLAVSIVAAAPVSGQGTWETTLQGRDLDGNIATAEAYYDTAQNITWLADANYMKTSGYDDDGIAVRSISVAFIKNLNTQAFGGYTNWRFPYVKCSYILDCSGTPTESGEMGHMYYITLGNTSLSIPGGGLTNTGPFINLRKFAYWYSDVGGYPPNIRFWVFDFYRGDRGLYYANTYTMTWPVHDGDIGRPYNPNAADDDLDGVPNTSDNCPSISNYAQEDFDTDGIGDACDDDDDNDNVVDTLDNCQFVSNTGQSDADADGLGDACDADQDGDAVANAADNCPTQPNADQADFDADGSGDICDADDDNDSIEDTGDNCPLTGNPGQENLDGDSFGDACDADVDGDGVDNDFDNCRLDANPGQDDTDTDGLGDACDDDDDADSIADGNDNCPMIFNTNQADADGDGKGDVCDGDVDGDGIANQSDNCPAIANSAQKDFDGDGLGDACDTDTDGDNVANSSDMCAETPIATTVHPENGCSLTQLCPCQSPMGNTQPWRNHGQYVSCVSKSADSFLNLGLISPDGRGAIVSKAAQSSCGNSK